MKIGIVTYWNTSSNYGQVLQCYALQAYLKDMGHEPFLIRYTPTDTAFSRVSSKIVRNLSIKKILYLFSKQRVADKKLSDSNLISDVLVEKRKFSEFRSKYIIQTEQIYTSIKQLRANAPKADVYICGSDQIWGMPLSNDKIAAYYLSFGDEETKRVAYAVSMGGYVPKGAELDIFHRYLDKFDKISLREEPTVTFCQNIGYAKSKVTLDPTLLLSRERYLDLCEDEVIDSSRPFIFIYVLNIKAKEEMYWDSIESYVNNEGLDVKLVYSSGHIKAKELIPNVESLQATIPQWLLCIQRSGSVITTSFHGVVFCIKLHRRFLAIMLQGEYSKGNDRIVMLLNKLGLSNRIFNPMLSVDAQMSQPIDWASVDKNLSILQQDSIEFLDKIDK